MLKNVFRLEKQFIVGDLANHLISYPTPQNLNYLWSFGSAAGICLVIQIASGIFLAMHYVPHVDYAFDSVEHIMRDVNYGWFIRYLHANGASVFFVAVYLHMFRGLFFKSYLHPREHIWLSGLMIFLLMMATAFMGYVLPWGQMSYWGVTVITNLFSAIPYVGPNIVEWIWGGFSVNTATLNRFFSFHYVLPFALVGMTLIHLSLLHSKGSTNPHSLLVIAMYTTFSPYYLIKDTIGFFFLFFFLTFLVCFYPNALGHPDNYIEANSMVTPPHIVPEWYFLPFYAILRAVPDKLGGVLAMFGSILALGAVALLDLNKIKGVRYHILHLILVWFFIFNFLILGWIGQQPVEAPYIDIGVFSVIQYFFYLICLII